MGRLGAIGCFTGCEWNAPGEDVTSSIASLRFNPIAANAAVGTISDYDLPQAAINHMPRLAVTRDPVAQPASGQQCISSPRPGFCVDGDLAGTYTKPITAGMPIGIQPSANRNMLGLSQGGPMPATALKKHGAVRRDTGGTNDIVLYSTPVKEPSPLATRMRADVPTNVTRLATMSNPSVPGTADTIDGGGNYPTPSRPLCITNCGGARGPVTKKTILNFLTGMAGHHVIIGQYENPPGTLKYSNAFTSLTGKHVAILGDGYWPGFPNNTSALKD